MKLMWLLIILFSLTSIAGVIGGQLFGATGAIVVIVLGLSISFIGIAILIGR
ncbi:MAG: hypothetical protein U1E25_13495 [Methylocystis sp.]